MREGSILSSKMSIERYKEYNDMYPLIEGYLFKKIDNIILLASLSPDFEYDFDFYYNPWNKQRAILRVESTVKGYKAIIVLSEYQKRIGIVLKDRNRYWRDDSFFEEVHKNLNIQKNNNSRSYDAQYDFKYNYKNCQRIVDIIEYFIDKY
ncbi:gp270 [Bacillus phage G]|uniref:Gp270 n=1 Tax=Bacillus phage G TaxID=2884420 RepID=G3MA11_9CAUD|nr:gp270 [Bacillus phage G]AEO93529.1 gp270 [Bacillus phage G]